MIDEMPFHVKILQLNKITQCRGWRGTCSDPDSYKTFGGMFMKKSIFLLVLSAFFSRAYADINGCYGVFQNGGDAIVCLSHVGEESLDGSGAFLGVFRPYGDTKPLQCWSTQTIVRSATDYAFKKTQEIIRFQFDNISFQNAKVILANPDGSTSEGTATQLAYSDSIQERMLNMTSDVCK
jgi:hypothetical protein